MTVQAGLCRTRSEIQIVDFLMRRVICDIKESVVLGLELGKPNAVFAHYYTKDGNMYT